MTHSVPQDVSAAGEVVLKLADGAQYPLRLVIAGVTKAGTANNTKMESSRGLTQNQCAIVWILRSLLFMIIEVVTSHNYYNYLTYIIISNQ
jgi:hypothetical protein